MKFKNFNSFLRNLTSKASTKTIILIKNKKKTVKAMIHLTSKNYLNENGDYYKIFFKEDGYLLIIPGTKEVYFSDILQGKIPGITDEMIGKKKIIILNGKKYRLENKDDYQFVLRLYVGSPLDIEGECRFSDYLPIEGPHEFLSLGWLSYDKKRADLHCKVIDLKDIGVVRR